MIRLIFIRPSEHFVGVLVFSYWELDFGLRAASLAIRINVVCIKTVFFFGFLLVVDFCQVYNSVVVRIKLQLAT